MGMLRIKYIVHVFSFFFQFNSIQFNSIKVYSTHVSQPVAELHMVTIKMVIRNIEHKINYMLNK